MLSDIARLHAIFKSDVMMRVEALAVDQLKNKITMFS